MNKKNTDYQKIMQLLGTRDNQNELLGIELLKSTMNSELLVLILSGKSFITYKICYPLVPFFQKHPEIWNLVGPNIPSHIKSGITKWMPHTLLELNPYSIYSFCKLANKKVKEYFPDFPKLNQQILTEDHDFGYGYARSGKSVIDGIGWSLDIESRDVGPAEVVHEEEWKAIAYHPDFLIKIELLDTGGYFPKIWLEKIPSK
jgi:hypothetical protein